MTLTQALRIVRLAGERGGFNKWNNYKQAVNIVCDHAAAASFGENTKREPNVQQQYDEVRSYFGGNIAHRTLMTRVRKSVIASENYSLLQCRER